jgi:hypothetical protein
MKTIFVVEIDTKKDKVHFTQDQIQAALIVTLEGPANQEIYVKPVRNLKNLAYLIKEGLVRGRL